MSTHWLAISTKEMDSINAELTALRAKCGRLETALRECVAIIDELHYQSVPDSAREALAKRKGGA